jgi:hypothetical protein
VAAAAVAALSSLDDSFDREPPVAKDEALAVLDDAIRFLRGGIEALRD